MSGTNENLCHNRKIDKIYEKDGKIVLPFHFLDNRGPEFDAGFDQDIVGREERKIRTKKEETAMNVLETISNRRSHRAYKADQIPEETLKQILTAGLESPSARNHQPWHFSVLQNAELIQEIHDEAARVMGKQGSPRFSDPDFQIFYHAPTVIFIFGEKDFSWTQVDCGIAVENMALAAEGLGIGSVILGLPKPAFMGEKAEKLKQKLQCPEGYDFVIALALGFATDTKEAHEQREEKISRIG